MLTKKYARLFVAVTLALCLVGISACSSPTSPGPSPTISLAIQPSSMVVPTGGTTNFTVSDASATCSAVRGKLTQAGTSLTYDAPSSGGVDELRCEKPGVQPGVAVVTVQGPQWITITAEDDLTYVRDQSLIVNPDKISFPAGIVAFIGGSSGITTCPTETVDDANQTTTCTGITVAGRGASNIFYAGDGALQGYAGTFRFRGQMLPLTPCPESVPQGKVRTCALLKIQ